MTAKDNRLFVEAVLYRYRAGIPWRDLPERFGPWKAVHTRFSRWAESGVWEKLFKALANPLSGVDGGIGSIFAVEYFQSQLMIPTASEYLTVRAVPAALRLGHQYETGGCWPLPNN